MSYVKFKLRTKVIIINIFIIFELIESHCVLIMS